MYHSRVTRCWDKYTQVIGTFTYTANGCRGIRKDSRGLFLTVSVEFVQFSASSPVLLPSAFPSATFFPRSFHPIGDQYGQQLLWATMASCCLPRPPVLWLSTSAVQPTALFADDSHRMSSPPRLVLWLSTHEVQPRRRRPPDVLPPAGRSYGLVKMQYS